MDEQNVFQNGFDEIDLKPNIGEAAETTSDSISNSLSGLCIPKQEPPPNSPLPPPHVDASNTSFLRQALLGECNVVQPVLSWLKTSITPHSLDEEPEQAEEHDDNDDIVLDHPEQQHATCG